VPIDGAPPSLTGRPPGCAFVPRCRLAVDGCRRAVPRLRPVGDTLAACHLAAPAGMPG